MSVLELGVLALSTWRLSHMLSQELGPWDSFQRLRVWAGVKQSVNGLTVAEGQWAKLVSCPLCLSLWVAISLYVLYILWPPIWPVLVVLALSGAASLLELIAGGRERS